MPNGDLGEILAAGRPETTVRDNLCGRKRHPRLSRTAACAPGAQASPFTYFMLSGWILSRDRECEAEPTRRWRVAGGKWGDDGRKRPETTPFSPVSGDL